MKNSLNNYHPYGSLISAGSWSGSSYNFGYNGMLKEGIGKDVYHTLNRGLFTIVPVWMKTDPLEAKFPDESPYFVMGGNPINFVDTEGGSPSWWRTTTFIIRNPYISQKIGFYKRGTQNISTNSQRFAGRLSLTSDNLISRMGNEVNAFRHTLWQSEITAQYGISIAKQAGDAHEENPDALLGNNFKTEFSTLLEADETVDLLNNIIGREIGKSTKGKNMKFRALVTLEYFKEHGLWTANPIIDENKKTIGYTISKNKISQEQYNNAKSTLNELNENGRTEGEQKKYYENKEKANNNMKSMSEGAGY